MLSLPSRTLYNDKNCGTPTVSKPSNPNPNVQNLNECPKLIDEYGGYYIKYLSCDSNSKVKRAFFSDTACNTKLQESELDVGKCLNLGLTMSQKFTCDSASSVGLAFFAVVAAILAVF